MYVPQAGTHGVPQGTPSPLPGAMAALVGAAALIVVLVPFLWPLAEHFNAMAHEAIAHLQPGTDDPALLDAQTTAVTTFIAGVFTRLVGGDRTISNAEQLARLLQAVATAVSLQRA